MGRMYGFIHGNSVDLWAWGEVVNDERVDRVGLYDGKGGVSAEGNFFGDWWAADRSVESVARSRAEVLHVDDCD